MDFLRVVLGLILTVLGFAAALEMFFAFVIGSGNMLEHMQLPAVGVPSIALPKID